MKNSKDAVTSYVLADSDWHYLTDEEGAEFRSDTVEEAKINKEDASFATDLPVDQIVILKETREEILI